MSKTVFDLLHNTHWRLRRCFYNPAMPGLTANGQARFVPLSDHKLDYIEYGELSNGGRFTKSYEFELSHNTLVVRHADPHNRGNPFQTLVLEKNSENTWECRATNFCNPDTYVSYWGFKKDHWSMHHDVRGPRKRYQIHSVFKPMIEG